MELNKFLELMKNNNAIRLNNDYILFNDLELYNFVTKKSVQFNNVDELMKYNFNNQPMKVFIENTNEFYNQIDGGRGGNIFSYGWRL